jgi:DNA invertase Pin-like site-specific DNA recombinase
MTTSPTTGLLIGYARVSTQGQDLAQQRDTLREVGCTRIFEEKVSGAKRERPELGRLLDHLRPGDVVTVVRLDRLARSTADLLHIAERIKDAGAGLRSLAEPWADTTTPAGRMVLTVFAGIADFERSLIAERTSAGRTAAKARGVKFGPRPSLSLEQVTHARQLIEQEEKPVTEVAALLGVHRATLYRALEAADKRVKLGSLLRQIGHEAKLTDEDCKVFDDVRNNEA